MGELLVHREQWDQLVLLEKLEKKELVDHQEKMALKVALDQTVNLVCVVRLGRPVLWDLKVNWAILGILVDEEIADEQDLGEMLEFLVPKENKDFQVKRVNKGIQEKTVTMVREDKLDKEVKTDH